MSALALYKPGDASPKNQEIVTEAITAFENYLADYPDDVKVRDFLMGLYIDAKKYDQALAYANRRLETEPNNVELFNYKIRVLLAQDKLQQASQLAQSHRGENQAAILMSVGAGAWNKSYNDPSLSFETRTQYVETGLQALEKSIQIKPDYIEAVTYYNLLLREKAKLTTDATERATLIAQANEYQLKAVQLRKEQAEREKAAAAAPAPQPET
jgi:tetratricopeptide (TPR) repeat protein